MPIQTASLNIEHVNGRVFVNVETPYGNTRIELDHAMWQGKTYVGQFEPKPETKLKRVSAKHTRRAAIRQEDSIAKDMGGRRQPGSGALPGIKGDVRVEGIYRIEAKHTRQKTYRLDRAELSKIRGECTGWEVPLFIVDFVDPQTGGSADRWVALPFHHFQRMRYEPPYETSHHRGPA
jgi:hypothetical protein